VKSRLLIFLFAALSLYIVFNKAEYKENMYQWDVSGYYLYLPAVFIYHDLGTLRFYPELNKKYNTSGAANMYGMFEEPGGKRNIKYAIGTALFELPFFLVAHVYCLVTHACDADGYTYPYQLAGIFSNIFWVVCGLFFLRSFLKKYFNDNITAFTLLCIAFGTNLYCYTAFAQGMSHPYGFFLFAGVLYYTDIYYRELKKKHAYWLGFLLGMVIITRPVNIVIAVIPLFWEVYSVQSLRERFRFFRRNGKDISIGAIIFFGVSFIQMFYWKYSTGHWIHYTYEGEGFNFLHPHIIDGLFSYQKGWFVYTPIALVCMFGLYALWNDNKKAAPAVVVFFVLMFYVVFSWRGWWYGGGFSARALIETLPVAAFPLAYLSCDIFLGMKNMAIKIAFSVAMSFFITLNLFQTYQYSLGIIHFVYMTKTYYWKVFGKTKITDESKYLMTGEEYFREIDESNK